MLILFLIEPIIKILYFKASTHFDFYVIISNLLSRTAPRDIFDFWLVFPIAGIALIKLRKWSYFIFLSMMLYTIFSLLTYEQYTWPYNSATPFSYHYFIVVISIISLILFLFPSIREPFFNQRLRWWESKTRYKTNINCKIISSKGSFDSKILNLSQSGVFLKDAYNFRSGEEVYIEFIHEGEKFLLPVKILSKHSFLNDVGWGGQFGQQSLLQKWQMLKLIFTFDKGLKLRN